MPTWPGLSFPAGLCPTDVQMALPGQSQNNTLSALCPLLCFIIFYHIYYHLVMKICIIKYFYLILVSPNRTETPIPSNQNCDGIYMLSKHLFDE